MINLIDLLLTGLIAYFFLLGFMRGFLRSIFGPLALIAGSWIAFAYYQSSHNGFIAFTIGIFAPMILGIFLRFFLSSWLKSLNPDAMPSAISRISGALITIAWGWTFVIFTVILIDLFPGNIKQVKPIQTLIHDSSIAKITVLPFRFLFIPDNINQGSSVSLSSAKELAQDPRLHELMDDPDIKTAAQEHNYAKLLQNPKIMKLTQEMMADPALMKKVLAAYGDLNKKQ